MNSKSQKSALISVYDKHGIEKIAKKLSDLNIRIISTGGTEKYLTELGYKIEKVENNLVPHTCEFSTSCHANQKRNL